MDLTHLKDRRTEGVPDPAEEIETTLNGITFRAGRRTAAHLIATDDALREDGMWLRVIQPCYNVSVSASAGTHDGDGCLDVQVMNATWTRGQQCLRALGWAAWYRPDTPGLWTAHIHMVSIGCPGPVGEFVPGQVDDYYRHTFGLKNQHNTDLDKSWFPGDQGPAPWPVGTPDQWRRDIDSTVFDYPAWTKETDMTEDQIRAIVREEIANYKVDVGGVSKVKLPALVVRLWDRTKAKA